MKIVLNIGIKPDAIEKLRAELEEAGGIEAAKQELSELILGDEETPDEIESVSISIDAPELEGGAA